MAKRVAVILSGCGGASGSDVAETMLTLLILDRAGAEAVCAAPASVADEVARVLPGGARPAALASLDPRDLDALIIPGGAGAGTVLSDYADKGQVCQVDADVTRLLRALLPARKPMAFMGLSAVLAARVLGPVAGVRVTFGSKHIPPAKHAAVMGADVRPASVEDVVADQKARVFSTPGFLAEGAHLAQVARASDRLVRGLLGVTRDRRPAPPAGADGSAASAEGQAAAPARAPAQAPAGPQAPRAPGQGTDPIRRRPATGPARGSA